MKNFLIICFSILFTNFIWSQVTVNAPSSVEVGANNNFGFTFLPSVDVPANSSSYKLTAWFITCGDSNMNNSNNGTYSNNSQALSTYGLNQSQGLNFPIKWEDNSNSLITNISIITTVIYYGINNNGNIYQTGNIIHSNNFTVNVNRILTPTITSTPLLECCNSAITISASNYGTADVFNWQITGGSVSGFGSTITVTPDIGNNLITANLIVSRASGISSYTKQNLKIFGRTARTALFTALYPGFINDIPPFDFICKSATGTASTATGRQMLMQTQCNFLSVNWIANGCTIIGQGTLTPTITPLQSIPNGNTIEIYAIVSFTGGCIAQTPKKAFKVQDPTASVIPSGSFKITPNNGTVCTADSFDLTFTPSQTENGYTTFTPQFLWGPADPIHYKKNRPTTVTVCNKNLCTGLKNCRTYTLFPPAPCGAARLANPSNEQKLIITPNPSNGNIKISLPEIFSGTYQVFEQTNSNLVQEEKFDNQLELQIELSQKLRNGIYILKVITENNTFTEKIILNK